MAYLEDAARTFEKRFMATHYSYRDFYATATGQDPTAATATYLFGTAARAASPANWPAAKNSTFNPNGDYREARNCYARSVMVQCTQDAYVMITSLNPRWIRHYIQYIARGISHVDALARLVLDGIAQTLTEPATLIPQNAMITFNPTYGVAITFFFVAAIGQVTGNIRFWIEGNTEGSE